jgi:putative membrane protein
MGPYLHCLCMMPTSSILIPPGQAWGASGQELHGPWRVLGLAGPLLLLVLLATALVRAVLFRNRYRAVSILDEADRAEVVQAVASAEQRTRGEILPVIVERSDRHAAAEWLAALSFLVLGSALLAYWLPWNLPAETLLVQFALGALGYGMARTLPGFKRIFITPRSATHSAEEQAFQEFFRAGLHNTVDACGVLLFVSLLEHRVVVIADKGIHSKVDVSTWVEIDEIILKAVRANALKDGLLRGIERAGELLARHFPSRPDDDNQIPDKVIIRKE